MIASFQRSLCPTGSSSPQLTSYPCRCPSPACTISTSSLSNFGLLSSKMSSDGGWTVRRSRARTKAQVASSASSERLTDSGSKGVQQAANPRANGRSQGPDYTMVETSEALVAMLEDLKGVDCIAVDCEGVKLGMKDGGKLCLIQIAARTSGQSSSKSISSTSSNGSSSTNNNGASSNGAVASSTSSSGSSSTSPDSSNGSQPSSSEPNSGTSAGSTGSAAARPTSNSNGRSSNSTGPLRTWLVDIVQLQWKAFHYRTEDKAVSLKGILEDRAVTKLMFDLRSDAAQLVREYGIKLRGAYDLQLAEVATRQLANVVAQYVFPLDKVLPAHLPRTPALEEDMRAGMAISRAWHQSNKTEVWEQRPLSEELLRYAATDVRYLHALEEALNMRLPQMIVEKVRRASATRAIEIPLSGPKRAEAPIIVGRKEFKELLNGPSSSSSNKRRPTASATGAPATTGITSSNGTSGDGVVAGTYAEAAAGASGQGQSRGGSEGGQQHGSSKQRQPKEDREEPVVKRSLPPRLTLGTTSTLVTAGSTTAGPSTSQPVSGTSAAPSSTPVGVSVPLSASYVLQPRKRAEGEEVPLWLYEKFNKMISPKSEPAEDEQGSATEGQGQEQGDGHEGAGSVHHSNGAGPAASSQAQPQGAEQQSQNGAPAAPPGLLWAGSKVSSSKPAAASKPELKRPQPPRRPGS